MHNSPKLKWLTLISWGTGKTAIMHTLNSMEIVNVLFIVHKVISLQKPQR